MVRWMTCVAVACGLSGVALAGDQKKFVIDKGQSSWSFDAKWKAADGMKSISFELPAEAIANDKQKGTTVPRKPMYEAVAAEVRAYGKTVKGVQLKATASPSGVQYSASGDKQKAKAALAKVGEIQDRVIKQWTREKHYILTPRGELSFDHAEMVGLYADDLEPVAQALASISSGKRDYVATALSFVQTIPYEALKRNGGDAGYRRPLALLARNRGDCDSKTVLFLALVKASYPTMDMAVIYVPGHALGAVGVGKKPGDLTLTAGGKTLVLVEPVGPGQYPVGATDKKNKKAAKTGDVHLVK